MASEADFDLLEEQQRAALAFLREHRAALLAMRSVKGVEIASLDFGISMRNVVVQSDHFEPELLAALAELRLRLVLSQYPSAGKSKKIKQYRRALGKYGTVPKPSETLNPDLVTVDEAIAGAEARFPGIAWHR